MECDDGYWWYCVCPPWASYDNSCQRLVIEKPRREEGAKAKNCTEKEIDQTVEAWGTQPLYRRA